MPGNEGKDLGGRLSTYEYLKFLSIIRIYVPHRVPVQNPPALHPGFSHSLNDSFPRTNLALSSVCAGTGRSRLDNTVFRYFPYCRKSLEHGRDVDIGEIARPPSRQSTTE